MALSYALLQTRYRTGQVVGCAVVVSGYVTLVLADAFCRGTDSEPHPPPSRLLGDALTVAAASLYALSYVLQERLLSAAPTTEARNNQMPESPPLLASILRHPL